MEKIENWFTKILTDHGDTARRASIKMGRNPSTISLYFKRGQIPPQLILDFARLYGEDPIEGLILIGYLTREEVTAHLTGRDLADFTDRELVLEILARIDSGILGKHPDFIRPIDEFTTGQTENEGNEHANIYGLAALDPGYSPDLETGN